MRRSWTWVFPASALSAGIAVGLAAAPTDAQQKNVLVAKKIVAAPSTEPALSDAGKNAQPLSVKGIGGKNLPDGSTDVTLRSVHTTDAAYVLMPYKDSTQSGQRGPWAKQADGSWKQLKDPDDTGGYKPGDEVPGIIVAPFTGDCGDIGSKSVWKGGVWTHVIARKLVTNNVFGMAVFDNAQVRHAYSAGVLTLTFE